MSEVGDIYLCKQCGRKIKVIEADVAEVLCCSEPTRGDLMCCSVPMKLVYKSN